MAILTFADQQNLKKISANNETVWASVSTETENFELEKLLGLALLQDVQSDPDTPENIDLLTGATFELNDVSVRHNGIKYVLAYLVHAAYLDNMVGTDTFTGLIKAKRPETEHVERGERNRIRQRSREIAMAAWLNVETYLNQNAAKYPLWRPSCAGTVKKIYQPVFTSLRKTKR